MVHQQSIKLHLILHLNKLAAEAFILSVHLRDKKKNYSKRYNLTVTVCGVCSPYTVGAFIVREQIFLWPQGRFLFYLPLRTFSVLSVHLKEKNIFIKRNNKIGTHDYHVWYALLDNSGYFLVAVGRICACGPSNHLLPCRQLSVLAPLLGTKVCVSLSSSNKTYNTS